MNDLKTDPFEPKPIPKELYSEYEERPFKICTRCGESLEHFEEGYQISKVFKRGEAVFEYALCSPCHVAMLEDFSSETREAMEIFYADNLSSGLGQFHCACCETHHDDLKEDEFALAAACQAGDMFDIVMICSNCMERTNALVSKETQGVWGDFINDNFPGVPGDALPEPTRLLVV